MGGIGLTGPQSSEDVFDATRLVVRREETLLHKREERGETRGEEREGEGREKERAHFAFPPSPSLSPLTFTQPLISEIPSVIFARASPNSFEASYRRLPI